jgi:hypothetical protein
MEWWENGKNGMLGKRSNDRRSTSSVVLARGRWAWLLVLTVTASLHHCTNPLIHESTHPPFLFAGHFDLRPASKHDKSPVLEHSELAR